MKFCALLIIVAAVCAMLPSHADGRATWVSRRLRARTLLRNTPLAARSLGMWQNLPLVGKMAGRRQADEDYLNSDEVAALLTKYDITMEELDDNINNDSEIEPEDREAIKTLAIMILSAFDENGVWDDSSEEDK